MATNAGLQPLSKDQVPVDPNVRIPEHVKAASSAADAIHEQFYPKDPNQQQAPNKEALPQPPAPDPVRTEPPAQQQQVDPATQQQQVDPATQQQQVPPLRPEDQNVTAEEWRHRFLSMQGRYQAKVRENASMEEQMRQLGTELVRTQQLLSQPPQQTAPSQAASGQGNNNLITDEDRANYGDELIDLARRAAMSSVAPELAQLREENQRLTDRVKHTGRRELFTTLDGQLPNWRQINQSAQFKAWLHLPNVYTGQVRGAMLKAAVDGAEAPKVLALFRDFLAEVNATGQQAPSAQLEQPATQQQAPRTAALELETLAAPGRARPAAGDTQLPSEKPIYSRAQISKFYDDSRKGLYAGREAEYRAIEADMQRAQSEGRIR